MQASQGVHSLCFSSFEPSYFPFQIGSKSQEEIDFRRLLRECLTKHILKNECRQLVFNGLTYIEEIVFAELHNVLNSEAIKQEVLFMEIYFLISKKYFRLERPFNLCLASFIRHPLPFTINYTAQEINGSNLDLEFQKFEMADYLICYYPSARTQKHKTIINSVANFFRKGTFLNLAG